MIFNLKSKPIKLIRDKKNWFKKRVKLETCRYGGLNQDLK